MNRHHRRAVGRRSENDASRADPNDHAALCRTGLSHLRAQRYTEAQTCSQQALALAPDHADTLHLAGLLSFQLQQYDRAAEWFAGAIRQDPRPEYFLSLGMSLRLQGRREQAFEALDQAVQRKPEVAVLWKNRGDLLVELERPADALLSFQRLLVLEPHHWDAANQCGVLLHGLGRWEEALSYFDRCETLRPDHFPTVHQRAICLCSLKGFDEALPEIRRAQALDPTNAEILRHVGKFLQSRGRDTEALAWFDQALKLRPDYADALHNKTVSLTRVHRFQEAFAACEELRAASPDDGMADLGRAHLQLLLGNFAEGWAGREARWKLPSNYFLRGQPRWLGEGALEGRTILVGADEGLGDTIQFARYVPMLAARGARVILAVQDSLCCLLSELPGVSQCIPISAIRAGPPPAFDVHCPIMSLPLVFGTTLETIPAPASYLPRPAQARVQAWQDRLGSRSRVRVGLVWSGNPTHGDDTLRSTSLKMLSRILDVDATFVSLQKDPRPADKGTLLERTDILDLTADLADFGETAALIACLDLVITVDTSVAHLAAALGCPTWILLPYTPDYRWLLDRDDSPWYPTARLFRQREPLDYATVVDRVRSELLAMISARS